MNSRLHQRRCGFLAAVGLLLVGLTAAYCLDVDRIIETVQRLGGSTSSVRDWQNLLTETRNLANARDKLLRVNEFFNRRIAFADDLSVWGQSDYWATPAETLATGKGDCEDFAIAKYFTLQNAGIANEQLRLVYVKARIGGAASPIQQAHMVLAYYPAPDAEPLVLDNLITDIRPASRRADLTPVFSFNSQGVWPGASGGTPQGPGGIGRLSRWQDLLQRARREGFD